MSGFRVTPMAQDDLKNIGRYTERQWGKRQRNTYLDSAKFSPLNRHLLNDL
jgi:plasmid stabilization system protein ParE